MESGTISKWNVAEGDSFLAGDSLAVIKTDKASMDFEAQDDGVVARLLVLAGTENVSVGAANMVTVGYRGAVMRRGTAGRLHNLIVTGYPTQAIDLRDTPTIAFARAEPPRLFANSSIVFGNNPTGAQFADNGADMFDEEAFFTGAARMNRAVDPMLPAYVSATPAFAPAAGSPASTGAATPPADGFFEPVTYVGAVPPGAGPNGTTGWTAYPVN